LIVPTICIFEVFKRLLQLRGSDEAIAATVEMHKGLVVPMDSELALAAVKLSVDFKLALADSVILATARLYEATLWTQDADFAALENVKFRPKDKTVI
jgi:predicted nucleic acid-binding protein